MSPGAPATVEPVEAFAPGRVNLIGEHTDYTGGLVLPMAIPLGASVLGRSGGDAVRLRSANLRTEVVVPLDVQDPRLVRPAWGRYVAGVVAGIRPATGFVGQVESTTPLGSGLSSSAALEVAVALALGFTGSPIELALLCQRAEQAATGVPSGLMDQLASAAGVEGHALLIDCHTLAVTPVALPDDVEVVVLDSGQPRRLADSAYAERRRACEAAEACIGPLRTATMTEVGTLDDPVLRARARHVVTENARVRQFAEAMVAGDTAACGRLMDASHWSLALDFEVSTPRLDSLVRSLGAQPGVLGVRLTGAGFGGCVVALAEPGALPGGWHLRPVAGARLVAP